jgi:hypothetical protein
VPGAQPIGVHCYLPQSLAICSSQLAKFIVAAKAAAVKVGEMIFM